MTRLFVGDQIQIALAIANFLILQAVKFIRQRAQGFGQQAQLGAVDREFAGLRFEQLAAGGDDIAEVPFLKLFVVDAFRQVIARRTAECGRRRPEVTKEALPITRRVIIRPATATSTFRKRVHRCPSHRIQHAIGQRYDRDGNRWESYALLTQRSQFFATSFQFIIKVNGLIGTLCLLFRHMDSS